MSTIISYLFIILCVLFIVIYFYILKKLEKKRLLEEQKQKDLKKQQELKLLVAKRKKEEELLRRKELEEKIKNQRENELYKNQKSNIKYMLYESNNLNYKLSKLYRKIVVENLWINEPFHSKIFEILVLLNKNELMIIDPSSKVIVFDNIRDTNNEIVSSKSYQVFNTVDIIDNTIMNCYKEIKSLERTFAQKTILSILYLILDHSSHYLNKEIIKQIMKDIFNDYKEIDNIRLIVSKIKNDESYLFVSEALKYSLSVSATEAYNDSEEPKKLLIFQKLPQKKLLQIYTCVYSPV